MQIEKVKDGLFLIRRPFNRCAPNGCTPQYGDDGLLHEAGDVAVRVTSEGLILVDDKYQDNVAEIMEQLKTVSSQTVKYLLNTHHHTDHAGGDALFVNTTEIIAHRNVRENFLRNKQPGAPRVTFTDQASVFLGGVEVRAFYFGRGHTNGDAVIYFPDLKVIHTGDSRRPVGRERDRARVNPRDSRLRQGSVKARRSPSREGGLLDESRQAVSFVDASRLRP